MSDTARKHAEPREYSRRRPPKKDERQPPDLRTGKQRRAADKRELDSIRRDV